MRTLRCLFACALLACAFFVGACSDDTTNPPDPDTGPKPDGPITDQLINPDTPLTPDTVPPPSLCDQAEALTLDAATGSVRVVRTASWLQPLAAEPKCAGSAVAAAPKMLFKFTAKKDQWYKLFVDTKFELYMYVFTDPTCTVASIEADCKSGAKGDSVGPVAANKVGVMYFKAPADGDVYVVMKAAEAAPKDFFALTVSTFTPPQNNTCAKAEKLGFFGGKASVANDTDAKLTPDEFSGLRCGGGADLDGPQVYYSFTAKKGTSYKITINPTFAGRLYVFSAATACTQADIEADCASAGAKGKFVTLTAGQANDTYFVAPADGDYKIGVDSEAPAEAGSFSLGVEEDVIEPPVNFKCTTATPVVFAAGKAAFNGTTIAALNEYDADIKCGNFSEFDGPQVYYKLTVQAGKAYRIKLSPKFSAYLYVFSASACGNSTQINTDCSSAGSSGDEIGSISSGSSGTLAFRPQTVGDYIIAIDSTAPTSVGNFDLEVEELDTPPNDTCAKAEALTLTAGEVTVSSTTAFALDEYAGLTCKSGGTTSSALDGPQLYWSLAMDASKNYAVAATTAFSSGYVYVFDGSKACGEAEIRADCESSGVSGNAAGTISSTTKTTYFKPPTSGTYKIGIDSYAAAGDVTLKVTEFDPAANQTCAAAQALTLVNNTVTEAGFTIGTVDEFAGAIKCGGTAAFAGGQTYYKVSMQANTDYFVALSADFQAQLYVFAAASACTAASIETDCASKGVTGDVTSIASANGGSASVRFRPTTAGDYYIVVDALAATTSGGYTLTINELVPPTGPRLVINEVNVGNSDYVVLRNAGTVDVSLNGVEIVLHDDFGSIAAPDNKLTLPNQMLKAGDSIYLVETSTTTGTDIYIGGNIFYGGGSSWVVLLCQGPCSATSSSNVIDAAQFGTTTVPLPSGVTFIGGPATGLTASNETTMSYTRIGFAGKTPTFAQSDWTVFNATR